MSLVGNYQAHYRNTEASYSQHYYGNRYELPSVTPPSIDTSYLGWSFSTYTSETSQDFTAQVQAKDYCPGNGIRAERGFKRRVTANRKERRRTLSINNAFQELRECIPNVPSDTKLSKIKTLRLATSYIAYLMDLLAQEDPNRAPQGGFKAELCKKFESREERRKREIRMKEKSTETSTRVYFLNTNEENVPFTISKEDFLRHNYLEFRQVHLRSNGKANLTPGSIGDRKSKGRTGWPQHVWALELKSDT